MTQFVRMIVGSGNIFVTMFLAWCMIGICGGLLYLFRRTLAGATHWLYVIRMDLRIQSALLEDERGAASSDVVAVDKVSGECERRATLYSLRALSGGQIRENALCRAQEITEHLERESFEVSWIGEALGAWISEEFQRLKSADQQARFVDAIVRHLRSGRHAGSFRQGTLWPE
jgi:hypothetical protein